MNTLQKYRPHLSVLGACLIQLVIGNANLWGGISLYVVSYLRQFQPDLSVDSMNLFYPLTVACFHVSSPFIAPLAKKIGTKFSCFAAIMVISLGAYLSSLTQNSTLLILTFAVLPGFAKAFAWVPSMECALAQFPQRKGLISGIVVCSFGLSTSFFMFVAYQVVNPGNITPSQGVTEGSCFKRYFDGEVYEKVPSMFQVFALVSLALGLPGALLLKDEESNQVKENFDNSSIEIVTESSYEVNSLVDIRTEPSTPTSIQEKSSSSFLSFSTKNGKLFWLFCAMNFFSTIFGHTIGLYYKTYGVLHIPDDGFITLVGSFAFVSNGISSFLWGVAMDYKPLKTIYSVLVVSLAALAFTLSLVASYKLLFLVWIVAIMFVQGGHFSIFLVEFGKIYGQTEGPRAYGIMANAWVAASASAYVLSSTLIQNIGYDNVFQITGGLLLVSLLLLKFSRRYESSL